MRVFKILGIVLIGVPIVLVAVIVGAVVALNYTDFNRYKPLIAEETRKATGRDLAISGNLRLNISLTPGVVVDGMTLSNAAWGSRSDMVSIRRLEAQFALTSLIFGAVEIKRIELTGADILLETNRQGHANFAFEPPEAVSAERKQPGEVDAGAGVFALIDEVEIRESRLTYISAATGVTYSTVAESLTLGGDGPDEPMGLVYTGNYNGAPVRANARLGAFADLLEPGRPWAVDLTLDAGGAAVTVNGTIAEPLAARGFDLAITVRGNRLGDVSVLAGAEIPSLGAYSISARMTGDAGSAINLAELKAKIGNSDFAGDATVTLTGERPFIDADISSSRIDLAILGDVAGDTDGAGWQKAAMKPDRIFPDDPLPLEGLKAVDADLQFDAAAVTGRGPPLLNAAVILSLKGGLLDVESFKAKLYGSTLDGSVQIDGRAETAGLAARATLRKVDLGPVLAETALADTVEGQVNFDFDVTGRGNSVRRIMASLDGRVSLVMGRGRVRSRILQTWVGGPRRILSNVLTRNVGGYTAINCALGVFDIEKGVATTGGFLLDTDVAAFVGDGTIDLSTEGLGLIVRPVIKKMTLSAAVPVHIRGTLANPAYSLDSTAVARRVGGLLGGLVYPPALILGLGELGAFKDGDCAVQAKPADGKTTVQQPSRLPGKILKGTGDTITKGLKGLFGQ